MILQINENYKYIGSVSDMRVDKKTNQILIIFLSSSTVSPYPIT